jgi:hypothetical protein
MSRLVRQARVPADQVTELGQDLVEVADREQVLDLGIGPQRLVEAAAAWALARGPELTCDAYS